MCPSTARGGVCESLVDQHDAYRKTFEEVSRRLREAAAGYATSRAQYRLLRVTSSRSDAVYLLGVRPDGSVKRRMYVSATTKDDVPEGEHAVDGFRWSAARERGIATAWHWTPYQAIDCDRTPDRVADHLVGAVTAIDSWLLRSHGSSDVFLSAPSSILALYVDLARERGGLLKEGSAHTIEDVSRFLSYPFGPQTRLGVLFNTVRRRDLLRRALEVSQLAYDTWQNKQGRDARFVWVVPAKDVLDPRRALLGRVDSLPAALMNAVLSTQQLESWLPFLTLEATNEIRRIRPAAVTELVVAARLTAKRDGGPALMPWDPDYPPALTPLPLGLVFATRPSATLARTLLRLAAAGIMSVGQLTVLHPEARRTIDVFDAADWIKLHRALAAAS